MASLSPEVTKAIRESVEEVDQPESVADKLISWVERIASGAESVTDEESVRRHIDVLLGAVEVDSVAGRE